MPFRLAERYWLEERLGEGAHGVVWRARDEATGEHVAVKILATEWSRDRSRTRREIAALRLSRTPGVVRLLDEGTHLGRAFIVMDLVEGRPFPGREIPVTWGELSPIALSLLETLGRVHASGIVHCDIKPTNAWVGSDGTLTLLDFGIADLAIGRRDPQTPEGSWLGTPVYLAPEVLLGDASSPASDLYAVGLLLYEALSGQRPFEESEVSRLLGARLSRAPRPLTQLRSDIPSVVADTVAWMLAAKPEARPKTAYDVLAALRDTKETAAPTTSHGLSVHTSEAFSIVELRELFVGFDRIFHHREDAAKHLLERTSGRASDVREMLAAWQRAGIVRVEQGRFRVEQEGIDMLRAEAWQGATTAVGARGALGNLALRWADSASTLSRILEESIASARALFHEGLHGDASLVLLEAARAVRLQPSGAGEGDLAVPVVQLFALWIEVSAMDLLPHGLDRLLYELAKAPGSRALLPIGELAQAALDLGQDPFRASMRLEALVPFEEVALERTRASLRMLAARSATPEREREVLAEIEGWASARDDATTHARVLGWRGRLAYRLNDFEGSASLHLESAKHLSRPIERAAALLNSASACSEAFQFEEAILRARDALGILESRRHPLLELRAEWVTRWASYRRGDVLSPDPELLEAAERVGMPRMLAPLVMLEAAVHFRGGHKAVARKHAEHAANIWTATRTLPDLVLLCRCFALACGGAANAEELCALFQRCTSIVTFGIEVQALALLRSAGWVPGAAGERRFEERVNEIPVSLRDARLDILSVSESLTLFRLT